jgi:hypothetical protein
VEELAAIGQNKDCMELKGRNPESRRSSPDRSTLNNDLRDVAARWKIEPEQDLVGTHTTPKVA